MMLQAILILLLVFCILLIYRVAMLTKKVKVIRANAVDLEVSLKKEINDLRVNLNHVNRMNLNIVAKAEETFESNRHKGYLVAGMKKILGVINGVVED